MHNRRWASVLVVMLLGALAVMAWVLWRNNQRAEKRFNVLLITLDTTRADRLGCYGYDQAETPTLDELAARGVRYENVYAPVPLTLPSHATILTGLDPPEHGLHDNARGSLGPGPAVLAEIFRDRGYRTAAFPAAFVLDKQFGLDRGFEVYDDRMGPPTDGTNAFHQQNPGNIVTDRASAWLGKTGQPFFAWVHFYDPHLPYDAPEPYRSRHGDSYDAEIAFMDAQIKRLLDFLDSAGLRENTLILAAGDHGESLGEHREREHGALIYNSTMRVPLIFSLPGQLPEGKVQSAVAGLIDVAATILDVLDWPQPEGIGGRSLLRAGAADQTSPGIYGESEWLMNSYGWAPLYSITADRWKYIEAPEPELYDCQADPGELKNLASVEGVIVDEMRSRLQAMRAAMKTGVPAAVALDAEELARLRSLGYVGGAPVPAPQVEPEQRQDPKKMMHIFNGCREAEELQAASMHREAIERLLPLIQQNPQSLKLRKTIIISYVELDELISAKPHAEEYLRQDPYNRNIIGCLAGAFVKLGKWDRAAALYRDGLLLPARPDEPVKPGAKSVTTAILQRGLGQVLELQKKLPEAVVQYEIYLKQVPDDKPIRRKLTRICFLLGKYETAKKYQLVALQDSPLNPKLHEQMGQILQAAGDHDSAIFHYQKAVELNPLVGGASRDLGMILWEKKEYGKAIEAWRNGHEHLPEALTMTYFLAFSLATCPDPKYRNGTDALKLASTLCEQTQHANPQFLDALAAAHAETGNFSRAVGIARQAAQVARRSSDEALAREIEMRLRLYEADKPFRTTTTVIQNR